MKSNKIYQLSYDDMVDYYGSLSLISHLLLRCNAITPHQHNSYINALHNEALFDNVSGEEIEDRSKNLYMELTPNV